MIAQVIIHEGLEITYLGWSSERFYLMDRDTDTTTPVTNDDITPRTSLTFQFINALAGVYLYLRLQLLELR